jgi:ABC-2 type transport system permease protein
MSELALRDGATRSPGRPAPGRPASGRPASGRPRSARVSALVMIGRSLRLSCRNTDALITALILPVMIMLLFVYLFGGAIHTGTAYVNYVVPGVLVLCAGFGSALTAVRVCDDMTGGIVDRFRSMDVGGTAFLAGQVAASAVRNAVSTVLVLGVALAIGFRPHAGAVGWLAAGGVLLAFIVAVSWLAALIGLAAGSPEAANGATFVVLFLPYASSGFVPIGTMPAWLRGFARDQPATPVIESLRAHLMGTPAGTSNWLALAWCGGILAVSAVAAAVLFQRRASGS